MTVYNVKYPLPRGNSIILVVAWDRDTGEWEVRISESGGTAGTVEKYNDFKINMLVPYEVREALEAKLEEFLKEREPFELLLSTEEKKLKPKDTPPEKVLDRVKKSLLRLVGVEN